MIGAKDVGPANTTLGVTLEYVARTSGNPEQEGEEVDCVNGNTLVPALFLSPNPYTGICLGGGGGMGG